MIRSSNLRQLADVSILRIARPSQQDDSKFQRPRDRDTRI